MKITKLIKVKKLYKVVLDKDASLLVNEQDLYDFKLYPNQSLSLQDFHLLQEKENYNLALEYALSLTSKRFYTRKQVFEKLDQKDYDKASIMQILDYLEKVKLLDDTLYQETFIENKVNAGYGPLYIKNKLYELGIVCDVKIDANKQYELLNNKYQSLYFKAKNINELNRKFKEKMSGQGFNKGIIDQVISNYQDDDKLNEAILIDFNKHYKKYARKYSGYDLENKVKSKLYALGYESELISQTMKEGMSDELY